MVLSNCGLCQKVEELQESHLMPKSLYSAIRNAYPTEGKQIVFSRMSDRSSIYTDYQVKRPFLCKVCEDRLNKHGEKVVSPECHRGEGKFILLDKVKAANPVITYDGEKWISPKSSTGFQPDKYIYFAASIIWRASAGNWTDGLETYKNSLGRKYQEQIRKYLLGETDVPSNFYLAVYVDNDSDILPLISFPTVSKKTSYHHHIFYIPGIKFSVILGAKVGGVQSTYSTFNTKIFFVEYSFRKHPDFKLFHKETKYTLKPKGRLAQEMKNLQDKTT